MSDKISAMKALNARLIEASDAYYNSDVEIMSNFEYDKLYDELLKLEKETGVILSNSITQNVGSKVVSSLKKSKHEEKMLSLAKTKSSEEIANWADGHDVCLSWKLDGLTVVMTYDNGELISAVTRGDGEIGEDITEQAKRFNNLPLKINNKNKIIVRGEAVISYKEFDRINNKYDVDSKFKNPRNLVSGTVKSLDLKVLDQRKVDWIAFTFVEGYNDNSYTKQLDELSFMGFDVVKHKLVKSNDIDIAIKEFSSRVGQQDIPVDGLVMFLDDTQYGKSLGDTSHHPRCAMAFKWQDDTYDTTLRDIIWRKSRTGRINPIAVFDPVDIDGTTVNRASLHNITYIEDMKLGIGDEISVYKANMIIPQVAENKTKSLKNIEDVLPCECPVCGGEVEIKQDGNTKFLYCANKNCEGSVLDQIDLFFSKMKVMGASKKTWSKLLDEGVIIGIADVFDLREHEEEFCSIEGLGEKKFWSLVKQIENIETDLDTFISALGIYGVNDGMAKLLAKKFKTFEDFVKADKEDIAEINGIGDKTAENIERFIETNGQAVLIDFAKNVKIKESAQDVAGSATGSIRGKKFAITGKVECFKNRKELERFIESKGGSVSGVSKSTDYLITNDPYSGSNKNKKAQELGIQLITEQEFIDMSK